MDGGAGGGQQVGEATRARGADLRRAAGEVLDGPGGDEPAFVDDDHVVDEVLDLGEQVARDQHGVAPSGPGTEQVAQVADALGVEAVGGFVEHQHRRVAEQCGGQREPLLHAERVGADPSPSGLRAEADHGEGLVDAGHGLTGCLGDDAQVVAARAPGMERVGFEHDADGARRVGEVAIAAAADGGGSVVGRSEVEQDLHGGGLAGSVGSEEPGDPTRLDREGEVVDHGAVAVALGEPFDDEWIRARRGCHGLAPFGGTSRVR